ncbi:MAG: TfoX/Sxy family protein [Desulfomonilia bacterium]
MKFSPIPEHLKALLEDAVKDYPSMKKTMFGCPAYFVNSNIFTGAFQDTVFLRLSSGDRAEILDSHPDVLPFEPLPGRIMREYVTIPNTLYQDPDFLHHWLKKSHAYASGLKQVRPKKHRSRS